MNGGTGEIQKTRELLLSEDRYLIITHEKPDGDAWGSMIALARWLRNHGKDVVTLINPLDAETLPLVDSLISAQASSVMELPSDWRERRLITVDLAGSDRLGFPVPGLRGESSSSEPAASVWLQIDHHPDNTRYATHNLILSDRPATAQILWELIRLGSPAQQLKTGFPADPELAMALAVGLLTDTLQLSTPHTSASSYVMAGELLAAGIDMPNLTMELQKELTASETLGVLELLSGTEMLYNDQLAVLIVTRADLDRVGLQKLHTHNALAILRTIRGARAFMVLVEEPAAPGEHKGSLRSTDTSLSIADVARSHGGGGHEQAAGFKLYGSYEEVSAEVDQMLSELGELLEPPAGA